MNRRLTSAALFAFVAIATTLSAHDTWLLPTSMRVAVGRPVRLSLTSGQAFAADDFAIDPQRVTRADVRLAGSTSKLATPTRGALSLRYSWTPKTTGIAALAIELAPKVLTLAPDKIEEYFADINASKSLRAAWDSIPSPKQWRESYSKHAASFILVGDASRDSSWHQPLGMGFELVPAVNPTGMKVGDVFRVHALRRGKPLANLEVGFQFDGDTHVSFATTDQSGAAQMKLTRSGRWLVNSTSLRRTRAAGLEWESDFATMTVAVAK